MFNFKTLRFAWLCGCLAVLVMVLNVIPNLPAVLCIEPNGSIALELSNAQGQCSDWQADTIPALSAKQGPKHCQDIPLACQKHVFHFENSNLKFSDFKTQPFIVAWGLAFFKDPVNSPRQALNASSQWPQPPPESDHWRNPTLLKTIVLKV